jgi:hypothetical protein
MRHAAMLLCAVVLGWLLVSGCGHHSVNNGFGGSSSTGGSGTTTNSSGGCLTSTDCPTSGSYYCQFPNDTCPKCFWKKPMCSADADCPTAQHCGPCKTCVSSCVATMSCPAGKVCDPVSQECVASCKMPSDCPTNFTCNTGMCVQKTCSTDADCNGFCAGGFCVGQKGTCTLCM